MTMPSRRTFIGLTLASVAAAGACSAQDVRRHSSRPGRASRSVPYIHDLYSGVGQGDAAIDTAAFTLAATRGLHKLAPGVRYFLQRGINVRTPGGGFVCDAGTATILMLTAPEQFDLDAYDAAKAYGPTHVGIAATDATDFMLAGVAFELQPHRDPRCAIAIAVRGGARALVDSCTAQGFDLPFRGIFTLQSNRDARFQSITVRDCGSSKDVSHLLTDGRGTAVQPQVTGIEVDNDTIRGAWSVNAAIRGVVVERLELTGEAAVFGQQSDGVNIQSRGECGIVVDQLRTSRVGEALDNFSSGLIARQVIADDTYFAPIKLIHGASRCRISDVRIRRTGFAAVQIANSTVGPVEHNMVTDVRADEIGIHHDRWCPRLELPSGVYFDGGAPEGGPRRPSMISNNLVQGVFNGHQDRMPALVRQISPVATSTARDNVFQGEGTNYGVFAEVIGAGGVLTVNGRKKA